MLEGRLIEIAATLTSVFAAMLGYHISLHPTMFTKRFGIRHRLFGAIYLSWLCVGYADAILKTPSFEKALIYDSILGVLGIALTLSAAGDFQHKNVKNVASGVLDEHATVTYGEMIEHSFYQVSFFDC
jgi:hypothetical protein